MPDNVDFDAQVAGIAALDEPIRRALYRFVVTQPAPVSRDQAAEGVGVPRHVAKFHLDKLADQGLLEVEFRRPPERRHQGPGAGRPAKLYRRAARELRVSLPERRYDLVGEVLAEAIVRAEHDGVPLEAAVDQAATHMGRTLADQVRPAARDRAGLVAAACAALKVHGYEPRLGADGTVTLVNCPFHRLSERYTELVCGINRSLISGLLASLAPASPGSRPGLVARLDPAPGRCCVTIQPARRRAPPDPTATAPP
jgi:predicted ArsR family transcriptional regulator